MKAINLSPVTLVFGDYFLACDGIKNIKKSHPDIVTISLDETEFDDVRVILGTDTFDASPKVIIVRDIPNRKDAREFVLDLAKSKYDDVYLILWDSHGHIKLDKKTGGFNKTWSEFISDIRGIESSKIVNYGNEFSEKDISECVDFVISRFEKANKHINANDALLFVEMVGFDRGLLLSEIEKFLVNCPSTVTHEFILGNIYPTSKEALLYKIGNALDSAKYNDSIELVEKFVESGINCNVIAEIFVKRARWQMLTVYFFFNGTPWAEISGKLMKMGGVEGNCEEMRAFLRSKCHYPDRMFSDEEKDFKKEAIPMQFMADQIVSFVKNRIVGQNKCNKDMVSRMMNIYLTILNKQASIRYNDNPNQIIKEMVRVMFGQIIR